jgi:hypothetical protein
VEIPGIGAVTLDEFGWFRSEPVTIPALGNAACHVLVNGYDDDPTREDFHAAIAAFLALDESALKAAAPAIFEYYQDIAADFPDDVSAISSPNEVWRHIRPGRQVVVKRDRFHDRHVYVSIECECSWEPEHGLQIVLRDGHNVTKVGPYDGHVTNVGAYGRKDLEGVVYHRIG